MKKYDLSQIMKSAHRTYKYMGKKQGKTFGEVLKTTWHLAKLQLCFSEEAIKARREKVLNERMELLAKAAEATPSIEYNNPGIPLSAYYNPCSTHRHGAHYVGD